METIIGVTRISSSAKWPIIFIPKEARELGFERGVKVLIKADEKGRLIIEKA